MELLRTQSYLLKKNTKLDDSFPVIDGTVYQYTKLSGSKIEPAFDSGVLKFDVEKRMDQR